MTTKPNTIQRSSGINAGVTGAGELVPELTWPNSNVVYDRMRKDAKCSSVLRALQLPVRGTGWHVLDSPGVRPEVVQMVRTNLGLFEPGESRRRPRGIGISWDPFLRLGLNMLPFGHMFFEPVYTVVSGQTWLARMAPILPGSISAMAIDRTGELTSISQWVADPTSGVSEVVIPRQYLLPLINEREGSDWAGQSVFRSAYKHWFLKDKLERLGTMIVERNGMGLPVFKYGEDGDRLEAMRAATAARAGETSGLALRNVDDFALLGVSGSLVDPMPQLTYHSQQISTALLAMFMDLGHDAGARNLGETFVDYFTMTVNTLIADLEETYTEQVSRTIVEMNYGSDEPYPEIVGDDITDQSPLTDIGLAALATAGVLTPDDSLQKFTRQTYGIPIELHPPSDTPAPPVVAPAPPAAVPVTTAHSEPLETLEQAEGRLTRMRQAMFHRRRQ